MSTNQVIRAAMSTGVSKSFDWDQSEQARAWALREASMLVERNEPIFDACHVHVADSFARQDSITRHAQDALAEALAAFVVADLG